MSNNIYYISSSIYYIIFIINVITGYAKRSLLQWLIRSECLMQWDIVKLRNPDRWSVVDLHRGTKVFMRDGEVVNEKTVFGGALTSWGRISSAVRTSLSSCRRKIRPLPGGLTVRLQLYECWSPLTKPRTPPVRWFTTVESSSSDTQPRRSV